MSACSLKCTSPDSHSPSQLYATRLDQPAATVPSLQASCQMPACQPNPSILPSQPALLHPCFFWQPHAINSPPATVLRTSTEHLQWQGPWCCMHVTNREKSAGMAAWSTVGNLGGSSRAGRRKWLVRNREQRRHRQQLDTQVRLCMVAEVLIAHPAQVDGAAEHIRWHGRRGQIAANPRNKHAKREGQCCIVACWRWPANWQAVCRQGKCP